MKNVNDYLTMTPKRLPPELEEYLKTLPIPEIAKRIAKSAGIAESDIPLEARFLSDAPITEDEVKWAKSLAKELEKNK